MNDKAQRIRLKVIGVFRKGDRILVIRVVDPADGRIFYVPPGGGVEFGERSEEALRREIREELNTELKEPVLIGVIENRFIYAGKAGHEVVFVYQAKFQDESRYETEQFEITESDGTKLPATWVDLTTVGPLWPPICPEGLTGMLKGEPV
jgi:8-oxo-dGTP pyrophosphatase MutT (NUDIX family)